MEKHAQMNKLLKPIKWTEYPTTTDFEGIAIFTLFSRHDGTTLGRHRLPVAKRGNNLVFVGSPIDVVTQYNPENACDFPERALVSAWRHVALYRPSFASYCMRKGGALGKKGIWKLKLFENAV
jgi:hypothetical protein